MILQMRKGILDSEKADITFPTTLGPQRNPAKRFRWGEDEQRNERVFGLNRKRAIWSL